MTSLFLSALRATVVLALLTGLAFPAFVTTVAQICFANQANGSLVRSKSGEVIGSTLIGQFFAKPEYFHSRPSAAGGGGSADASAQYKGEMSSGTNLGPTSAKLINGDSGFDGVKQLSEKYRAENLLTPGERVPVDAVTRSGSGLDPDISQQNALLQARRVAAARHRTVLEVENLVRQETIPRQLGIFGEPRVNVLSLNMALDRMK
ncbi:MAG: potassium-transporting ATPase subunit KdpC [Cyanobacteria bacterium SZAS LIN-2]|nr:potassium-transporting ATPase subunit KdpC [Cyanobacteria bacterium SZAS LIN-2]